MFDSMSGPGEWLVLINANSVLMTSPAVFLIDLCNVAHMDYFIGISSPGGELIPILPRLK
jgi:hypothetical protein